MSFKRNNKHEWYQLIGQTNARHILDTTELDKQEWGPLLPRKTDYIRNGRH